MHEFPLIQNVRK